MRKTTLRSVSWSGLGCPFSGVGVAEVSRSTTEALRKEKNPPTLRFSIGVVKAGLVLGSWSGPARFHT